MVKHPVVAGLLLVVVACASHKPADTFVPADILVQQDRTIRVHGSAVELEQLAEVAFPDTIIIEVDEAASYGDLDAVTYVLHESGQCNVVIRGDNGGATVEVPMRLAEPDYPLALSPTIQVHIRVLDDGTIRLSRPVLQPAVHARLEEVDSIIAHERTSGRIGFLIDPTTRIEDYLRVLSAIQHGPRRQAIVNAPSIDDYLHNWTHWQFGEHPLVVMYWREFDIDRRCRITPLPPEMLRILRR